MSDSRDFDPAVASAPKGRSISDDLAYDRTDLAVERTYAAWLRTGLSVAAGGIVIARLVPAPERGSMVALALGGTFVVLGIALIAYGARHFATVTERLARARARPHAATSRAAYALTVVVAALLLAVLIFLWTHRGQGVAQGVEGGAVGADARRPPAWWSQIA